MLCVHQEKMKTAEEKANHVYGLYCLPLEVREEIFKLLSVHDLIALGKTCSVGKGDIQDPYVWALKIDTEDWSGFPRKSSYYLRHHLAHIFGATDVKVKAIQKVNIAGLAEGDDTKLCLQLFTVRGFPYSKKIYINDFRFVGQNLSADAFEAFHYLLPCRNISITIKGTDDGVRPFYLTTLLTRRHPQLRSLSLSNQKIHWTAPWSLPTSSEFVSLTDISLTFQYEDSKLISQIFKSCPNIIKANFNMNNFKNEAFEAICISSTKLKELTVVAIGNNRSTTEVNEYAISPAFGKSLQRLSVGGVGIDMATFNIVADFTSLQVLEFLMTKVNVDEFISKFLPFPKLTKLTLNHCRINKSTAERFSLVPKVEILDLSNTGVGMTLLKTILRNSTALKIVHLDFTNVCPADSDRLEECHKGIRFLGIERATQAAFDRAVSGTSKRKRPSSVLFQPINRRRL